MATAQPRAEAEGLAAELVLLAAPALADQPPSDKVIQAVILCRPAQVGLAVVVAVGEPTTRPTHQVLAVQGLAVRAD